MAETKWMPKEQEQHIVQLIVFHLEDEEFGVPISEVREIIATGPVTPIPNSPKFTLQFGSHIPQPQNHLI